MFGLAVSISTHTCQSQGPAMGNESVSRWLLEFNCGAIYGETSMYIVRTSHYPDAKIYSMYFIDNFVIIATTLYEVRTSHKVTEVNENFSQVCLRNRIL